MEGRELADEEKSSIDPAPTTEAEWKNAQDTIKRRLRSFLKDNPDLAPDLDDLASDAVERYAREGGSPSKKADWVFGDWKKSKGKTRTREMGGNDDRYEDASQAVDDEMIAREALAELARQETITLSLNVRDLRRIDDDDLDPDKLRAELGRIGQLYALSARKHGKKYLDDLATLLRMAQNPVLSAPQTAAAEKRASDPAWKPVQEAFAKAVGSQRHAEKETNTGPRTQQQEVDFLLNRITRCLALEMSVGTMADEVLAALRCLPILAGKTTITQVGKRERSKEDATLATLSRALVEPIEKSKPPHLIAIAVLTSLGADEAWARNTFPRK